MGKGEELHKKQEKVAERLVMQEITPAPEARFRQLSGS